MAFCDVDVKKINKGYYIYEESDVRILLLLSSVYNIIIVDDSQAKGTYHPFQRSSSTSSDLCEMGKESCDPFNIVW